MKKLTLKQIGILNIIAPVPIFAVTVVYIVLLRIVDIFILHNNSYLIILLGFLPQLAVPILAVTSIIYALKRKHERNAALCIILSTISMFLNVPIWIIFGILGYFGSGV